MHAFGLAVATVIHNVLNLAFTTFQLEGILGLL